MEVSNEKAKLNSLLDYEDKEKAFDEYIEILEKDYKKGSDEYNKRFKIFTEQTKKIKENREKYEKGEVKNKLGVNNFTDMTEEEFAEKYGL